MIVCFFLNQICYGIDGLYPKNTMALRNWYKIERYEVHEEQLTVGKPNDGKPEEADVRQVMSNFWDDFSEKRAILIA